MPLEIGSHNVMQAGCTSDSSPALPSMQTFTDMRDDLGGYKDMMKLKSLRDLPAH